MMDDLCKNKCCIRLGKCIDVGDMFWVRKYGPYDNVGPYVLISMRPSYMSPYKNERESRQSLVTVRDLTTGIVDRFGIFDHHEYIVLK